LFPPVALWRGEAGVAGPGSRQGKDGLAELRRREPRRWIVVRESCVRIGSGYDALVPRECREVYWRRCSQVRRKEWKFSCASTADIAARAAAAGGVIRKQDAQTDLAVIALGEFCSICCVFVWPRPADQVDWLASDGRGGYGDIQDSCAGLSDGD